MKLERISANKIKYSITFEELTKKGFLQDEILKDTFIWDVLFDEMLDEAARVFELKHFGAVSVEIFSLTSKELVLILTIDEEEDGQFPSVIASDDGNDGGQSIFLYEFDDFEYIILLSKRLNGSAAPFGKNSLYVFKNKYYVKVDTDPVFHDYVEAIFSEYGAASGLSFAYIDDYGELMIKDDAITLLQKYF